MENGKNDRLAGSSLWTKYGISAWTAAALVACHLNAHGAIFEGGFTDPGSSGSGSYMLPPGSSGLRGKTIDNNFFKPSGGSGTVLRNINMFTGQPYYVVPIGSIGANGGATFPIAFTYGGNIRQMYDADNERGPTSWIGYGWHFGSPFVSVNHKGTASYSDDVFFCDLGEYGGGQLLENDAGKFFVTGNPAIVVFPPTKDAEGFIQDWKFQMPNGVIYEFGKDRIDNKSKRWISRTGAILSASPYTTGSAKKFNYRWDLSRISDYNGLNVLALKYEPVNVSYNSASYTRESYLKEIIWLDRLGTSEVEKYVFMTMNKDPKEYSPGSFEPILGQRLYETKKLQQIDHYYEGDLDKRWKLTAPLKPAAPPEFPYPKARLTQIDVDIRNPRDGSMLTNPKAAWKFDYDEDPYRHSGLKTISKPYYGTDQFVYGRPDYRANAQGADWVANTKQDPAIRQLRGQTGQVVTLPTTDDDVFKYWENQSVCGEKFCLIAAVNRKGSDELNLEVWKNNGNYFTEATLSNGAVFRKTFKSVWAGTLSLIPWNDNFLLVDAQSKTVTIFEWDGKTFQEHGYFMRRKKTSTSESSPVTVKISTSGLTRFKVTLGGDYFLVHDDDAVNLCDGTWYPNVTSRIYVVKKIGGKWMEVNENECFDPSSCVNNVSSANLGESVKITTGCMEFNSKDLFVSAAHDMFHVIDKKTSIIFSYVPNLSATGPKYTLISDKYLDFQDPLVIQKAGSPMNWNYNITEPVKFGKDYFLIKSQKGTESVFRYDVMHYDGVNVRRVGTTGNLTTNTGDQQLTAYPSADYFVTYNKGVITMWRKQTTSVFPPVPDGMKFVAGDLLAGPSGFDMLIKTSPYALAVECYKMGSTKNGIPNIPPEKLSDGNYAVWLWEVDPAKLASGEFPGRMIETGFKDGSNRSYYDISFSPTDNIITAKSCVSSTGTACSSAGNDATTVGFVNVLYNPGAYSAGQPFLKKTTNVYSPILDPAYQKTYSSWQFVMSAGARIGVQSAINRHSSSRHVDFTFLQSMGEGFSQYPFDMTYNNIRQGNINFVSQFITNSGIQGAAGGGWDWKTVADMYYLPSSVSTIPKKPEYNANTQTFIFPAATQFVFKKSNKQTSFPGGESAETYWHSADMEASKIPDDELMRLGQVAKRQINKVKNQLGTFALGSEMSRNDYEYSINKGYTGWPINLKVSMPSSVNAIDFAENGSSKSTKVTFHGYNPASNSTLFTKTKVGTNWILKQDFFETSGPNLTLSHGSRSSKLALEPATGTLDAWNMPNVAYSENDAPLKAVAVTDAIFDPVCPFSVQTPLVWKDEDPTLTDEQLRNGADPIFLAAAGLEQAVVAEKRNALCQVLENKFDLDYQGGEKRTALFYEGRGSLPVGNIEDSHYEDAAMLLAENGSVTGLTGSNDWENRWKRNDNGYSNQNAHTGKYSISVLNKAGPTIDLKLKGVSTPGYEYVISAWVYANSNINPSIKAERLQAGVTSVETFPILGNPVGEAFTIQKWQRYEMRLTAAQLKGSQNLFSNPTAGDVLRVSIGVASGGSVQVDDIVCRPSRSVFAMRTFDEKGHMTSSTNSDHLTSRYEYDLNGNFSAKRDDKYRIFNSRANHVAGEND